jgi:RNA polymerase sigma factor (sigma-70 family)
MANDHLSWISTSWSLLRQAHEAAEDEAAAARQLLFERYGGAVRRFLTAVLCDSDAAEELTQEFAVELVRGGFRGANPERGRFRDYVKSSLIHLVGKHRRRKRRRPQLLSPENPALTELALAEDNDRNFDRHWRAQLLARAWEALAQTNQDFYVVLRFRVEHPEMRSEQMAKQLESRVGRLLNAAAVRQTLRRARERFALLLLDAVAHSLLTPSPERIEDELAALDLLEYCRDVIARLRKA